MKRCERYVLQHCLQKRKEGTSQVDYQEWSRRRPRLLITCDG